MVVLHASHAPRPLCDCYGAAAPRFGDAGDVCRVEGCGTRLSRYNPLDVCDRHQRRGHHGQVRKQAKRTPTASCAAAEDFMEPARLPSKEELEMAGEERRKIGATKTRVLEYVALKGGWVGCGEIAERIGLATSTATSHLQDLFQAGRLERRAVEHGTGYRYRTCSEPESAKTTPASSQASAPLPQGEHPAAAKAAPPGPAGPSPEEPPAAGFTSSSCTQAQASLYRYAWSHQSRELHVIAELEAMPAEIRARVLTYAVSRWFLPENVPAI